MLGFLRSRVCLIFAICLLLFSLACLIPSREHDDRLWRLKSSLLAQAGGGRATRYGGSDGVDLRARQIEFWQQLSALLEANGPAVAALERTGAPEIKGFDGKEVERQDLLKIGAAELDEMKEKHQAFVEAIRKSPPQPPYRRGTRGIVTTAGGEYLPIAVISLRMLRRTNAAIPVEVMVSDQDEYEEHICQEVLPELNARCIVIGDIISATEGSGSAELTTYQLKIFAMLFSSFEEILLLDADTWPVENPETLFESEPYRSKGLVLWPDFWASTASHHFFAIASQPTPATGLRASTESGEIIVSKKSHAQSLLLATYYNFYGPGRYYPLLSQGAPGEGDKETFLASAAAMNQSFYAVGTPVRAIGHWNKGKLEGSAMVQHHPSEDYEISMSSSSSQSSSLLSKRPPEAKTNATARPLFLHVNFPKFNPVRIYDTDVVHRSGVYTRAWTAPLDAMDRFGFDVEESYWRQIAWVACHLEDKFSSWSWKKEDQRDICDKAKEHYGFVFGRSAPA